MLSGSIPSIPGDLLSLENIEFTFNNLTDHIPNDMFDHLPNLKGLYLSYNLLSGRIPISLCKCKELQILSLSVNQLEGSLPVEIGNLSMLQSYMWVGTTLKRVVPLQSKAKMTVDCSPESSSDSSSVSDHYTVSTNRSRSNCNGEDEEMQPPNQMENSIPFQTSSEAADVVARHTLEQTSQGDRAGEVITRTHNQNGELDPVTGSEGCEAHFQRIPADKKELGFCLSATKRNLKAEKSFLSAGKLANCVNLDLESLTLPLSEFLHHPKSERVKSSYLDCAFVGGLAMIELELRIAWVMLIHACCTIPHQISNLKSLEYLDLGVNNIAVPIPPAIFNISILSTIDLTLNQLSGYLPSNMGLWLPNLEELYFGGNQFIGPLPMSIITNASQLSGLDMSINHFSGSIPDNLGDLRNLKILNLESNNLTSLGMRFLSSLTNCEVLEILAFDSNPLISGTIPASIGGLQELQSVFLQDNRLEGSIPSELCHLTNLAYLDLSSNKLSEPIPAYLGNIISLRNLFLGSNMFSSSIPSTLTRLNDLLILDLSSNSLSGPLPIDIGNWKVLTSMNLSNNQFSGDIPTGVANLNYLTQLSLSNNRLTECSAELPDERPDMKETVTKLKKIRAKFLKDTERFRQRGNH
ncbi:hypothetical protein V6N11_038465 [Hibiscus sabdariffa]|uniref:Uncharacterized protein n=1 Tax=Hibiscus sabdariffa TaxID=183260 RepID=A0ABR2SKB8_9ROSI